MVLFFLLAPVYSFPPSLWKDTFVPGPLSVPCPNRALDVVGLKPPEKTFPIFVVAPCFPLRGSVVPLRSLRHLCNLPFPCFVVPLLIMEEFPPCDWHPFFFLSPDVPPSSTKRPFRFAWPILVIFSFPHKKLPPVLPFDGSC